MPHDALLKRIRAEYLEMPGLRLKLEQAQRLCGVERALCQRVLGMLVDIPRRRLSSTNTENEARDYQRLLKSTHDHER